MKNSIHSDRRCAQLYNLYHEKQSIISLIKGIKKRIQSAHDVLQMDELKCRKRVLRRLGFTTTDDVVEMKGRVACEISTGDELLLTEMIFNGVFNPLLPEFCAALLSCFVFAEKVSPFQPRYVMTNGMSCSLNNLPNSERNSKPHYARCKRWPVE